MSTENIEPVASSHTVESAIAPETGAAVDLASAIEENLAHREGAEEAEAGAEGEASEGGEVSESDEAGEAGAEASTGAEGGEGKKKRRRKKKSKGPGGPGEGVNAAPKRDLPFSRYFGDGRKHAFAPGEIIAGRVAKIEGGVATIDLFGKAAGYCSANEPRDVPIVIEEPAAEEVTSAGAVETATSEAEGAEHAHDEGTNEAHEAEHSEHSETEHLDAAASEHEAHAEGAQPEAAYVAAVESAPEVEETSAVEAVPEEPELELGTIFRARVAAVSESGHLALANRIAKRPEVRTFLAEAREARRRVFGTVFGFNRGGFDILVEGIRAFCPISGLSLGPIENPEALLGQKLEFSVQQAKSGHQGIVVSRRNILEREARRRARELRKSLEVGQVVHGMITDVREFGAFVDIGGIEGLVHISEMSWDRAARATDLFKRGDMVDAKVIRLSDGRKEGDKKREGRISLSIKAVLPDPWVQGLEGIGIGTVKQTKIVRLADFGAFLELAPGVEGLLHITELGANLKHPSEKAKVGDELVVVVDRMDIPGRRVSLSKLSDADAKAFLEGQLAGATPAAALKPGAHLKVKVTKIEAFGVLVQVDGVLGRRGRGIISNIDMGTQKGADHRKQFPVGTEVEVKFVGADRDGTMKFSRKGFFQDEERKAVHDYRREAAQKGFGTFGDLLKNKLNG